MFPVFATKTDHDPEPTLHSILYPVIGEPPSAGVTHSMIIDLCDNAVAVNPVGAPGTVAAIWVVAVAVLDGELVPIALIALTLYSYVVDDGNPESW